MLWSRLFPKVRKTLIIIVIRPTWWSQTEADIVLEKKSNLSRMKDFVPMQMLRWNSRQSRVSQIIDF